MCVTAAIDNPVSGDWAACREARELLGDIETAPVKTGYDCYHADCLHPTAGRDLIHSRVVAALGRLDDFKPFVIPGPIRMVQRSLAPLDQELLRTFEGRDDREVVDPHTVAYKGRNVVEAMARRCGIDYAHGQ